MCIYSEAKYYLVQIRAGLFYSSDYGKSTHNLPLSPQFYEITLARNSFLKIGLTKLNIIFSIQSSNCALRYLYKWTENFCPHRNLQTNVYSISMHSCKNQKQSRYPSIGEYINKLWYIHKVECYSGLKRNALSSYKKHGGNLNA